MFFVPAAHGYHVGQQHGERLVADEVARAPHGMAEAERNLLAREARRPRRRPVGDQGVVFLHLAALLQRVFEFVGDVEMIFDHRLVAARDEDEMLDARFARLVDDVLEHGPIDDRQHLLRDRLGGRQKTRAEPGDGKDSLANRLDHDES